MLRAPRVRRERTMNRISSALSTLALVVTWGTSGCGGSGAPIQPAGQVSDQAHAYLEQLIGLMQANSINRLLIDWNAFRTTIFGEASRAQTVADTYPAIRLAIRLIGDGHSSFQSPTGAVVAPPTRA